MPNETEGGTQRPSRESLEDFLASINDDAIDSMVISDQDLGEMDYYVRVAATGMRDDWHRERGHYDQITNPTDEDYARLAEQRAAEKAAAEDAAQKGTAMPSTLRDVGLTALSGNLLPKRDK